MMWHAAFRTLAGPAALSAGRIGRALRNALHNSSPSHSFLPLPRQVGKAVGSEGLVAGQVVDIKSEGVEGVGLDTLKVRRRVDSQLLLLLPWGRWGGGRVEGVGLDAL